MLLLPACTLYPSIYLQVEGDFPKYGNDNDDVDSIATWVADKFSSLLSMQTTYRNSIPTLSVLTITSNGARACAHTARLYHHHYNHKHHHPLQLPTTASVILHNRFSHLASQHHPPLRFLALPAVCSRLRQKDWLHP